MTNEVSSALYAVVLAAAVVATPERTEGRRTGGHRLAASVTVSVLVGSFALAQLTIAPWLLDRLQRNWTKIEAGQMWHLVTSLVVQDGGLPGTAFNLVSLVITGVVAETVWGWRRWLVLVLISGIGAQFWGWIVQPVGGGNSVVVSGLRHPLPLLGCATAAPAAWPGSFVSWPQLCCWSPGTFTVALPHSAP